MANPAITGPGLFYVTSRIERTKLLDEETFFKWYDNDHIDEIVHTSGMKTAFRYRAVNAEEKIKSKEGMPYLAFYPMDDLGFTQTQEFRDIRVKSDMLPGSGVVYDLAEFDVRYLRLVSKAEPKGARKGPAQCLVVFGVEPGAGSSNAEVEAWFKDEHIPAAASVDGYLRTTFYHMASARTNAQSKALKGLPTSEAPAPELPTWLAIHEFSKAVSMPAEFEKAASAEKVLSSAKQVEKEVYKLVKALGRDDFFD